MQISQHGNILVTLKLKLHIYKKKMFVCYHLFVYHNVLLVTYELGRQIINTILHRISGLTRSL